MDSLTDSPGARALRSEFGPGLYVHVPFCRRLCSYCDFYVVIGRESEHARFVDRVLGEAARAKREVEWATPFRTLFLGGGTPSLLSARELTRLLEGLRATLPFAADLELSVEANPESIDEERAMALRSVGVTRVSLGVQSMRDLELEQMARPHTTAEVSRAMQQLRRAGIPSIAVDLIYGWPGSTVASLAESADAVLDLAPDHVSAYLLTLEEKTSLGRQVRLGELAIPDEEVPVAQYDWLRGRLAADGFAQYEISNFARPGHASRHNQNYWLRGDYLGLGPAAHSHHRGHRWSNPRSLHRWGAAIDEGRVAPEDEERIAPQGAVAELLFLGLRRTAGVEWKALAAELTHAQLESLRARVARFVSEGWIEVDADRIRLAPRAYFISNAVLSELLLELDALEWAEGQAARKEP
ncbi:MAG: radical SAM family heme chaperone HemW [Candidatus Eisenbacteria bacterium]